MIKILSQADICGCLLTIYGQKAHTYSSSGKCSFVFSWIIYQFSHRNFSLIMVNFGSQTSFSFFSNHMTVKNRDDSCNMLIRYIGYWIVKTYGKIAWKKPGTEYSELKFRKRCWLGRFWGRSIRKNINWFCTFNHNSHIIYFILVPFLGHSEKPSTRVMMYLQYFLFFLKKSAESFVSPV